MEEICVTNPTYVVAIANLMAPIYVLMLEKLSPWYSFTHLLDKSVCSYLQELLIPKFIKIVFNSFCMPLIFYADPYIFKSKFNSK